MHTMRTRGLMNVYNSSIDRDVLAQLKNSVEDFKEAHFRELREIRAAVDEFAAYKAAMEIGGGGLNQPEGPGHLRTEHAALASFAKSGTIDFASLTANLPSNIASTYRNAMTSQSDPGGGYLVMPAVSEGMTKRLFDASPMRRLARYEQITAGDRFLEVDDRNETSAAWVGEQEARPETNTPDLGYWSIPLHEIYALQKITQRLLDDSGRDVGAWIAEKISDKFSRSEGTAYITGDGMKKPRGILAYPTVPDADLVREPGKIQHVISGDASTLPMATAADTLRTMMWTLRAPYRSGATWLMNSATAQQIDKLKDGQGNYLWRPGQIVGTPASLLGYPVEIDENMPNIAANAYPIAFGNFALGYCIIDRPGIKLLRDPYTAKPNVNFYAYRRTGGGVTLDDAIKLLKISAS
jgi:HK97 family phage major capsid protein